MPRGFIRPAPAGPTPGVWGRDWRSTSIIGIAQNIAERVRQAERLQLLPHELLRCVKDNFAAALRRSDRAR